MALGIMLGLVAYSPKIYRVFCSVTGYGGTTQRAYADPAATSSKTVTVAFGHAVNTITLSYTLLRSVNSSQSKNLARFLPCVA